MTLPDQPHLPDETGPHSASAPHWAPVQPHTTATRRGRSSWKIIAIVGGSVLTLCCVGSVGLAAIGSHLPAPKPTPKAAATRATAKNPPASAAATTEPAASAPAPTTPPSPHISMTQPAPVVPTRAVLTGFGATEADWNAHHAKHPDYPSGMVYNPAPSLPRVNGLIAGRYFQVMFLGGRATAYSERLAPGTPFDQALATARAELPADAKELWRQRKDTCEQIKLTSATLASALGDTGNSNAGALITFASPAPDPYQPGNLTTANFISDSSATADESPGC